MSTDYPEFRRRLDLILRQRDAAALRAFLIAEGQWEESTTTDPERAMWMMIASSPALRAMRDEATRWLTDHGFASEAHLLGHAPSSPAGQGRRSATRPTRSPDSPPTTAQQQQPRRKPQ